MPFDTPPGIRVPYDLDGTTGFFRIPDTNELFEFTKRDLQYLNSENTVGLLTNTINYQRYGVELSLVFPSAIRLRGFFLGGYGYDSVGEFSGWVGTLQTSEDSTNSVDGNWKTVLSIAQRSRTQGSNTGTTPAWSRSNQSGLLVTSPMDNNLVHRTTSEDLGGRGIHRTDGPGTRNVKALRLTAAAASTSSASSANALFRIHVYGEPDTAARPDRLQMWRTDVDLPMGPADLDWGDVPRSSTQQKAFKVKNVSTTRSAVSVVVRAESQSVAAETPSPPPQGFFLFSINGGVSWTSEVSFSVLSPGALTPEILVRQTVPAGATLSTWSPRITALVDTWN